MKIQTKTTILFTVLTGAVFLVLGLVVYFLLYNSAYNDFDKRLELRARLAAKFRFEQHKVSTASFQEIQREYLEKLPNETSFVLDASKGVANISPAPPKELDTTYLQSIINLNGATAFTQNKFRHYAGLLYKTDDSSFIVIESATNLYAIEIMKKLRNTMLITLLCAVVLIYLIGHVFSNNTFLPFRTINKKVTQINENNLHLRLEELEGTDEIAELTRTFNSMIDRIEMAFETQSNFISNASHELRTPLTAIAGEAEFALAKERSKEEYQQSLQQVMVQAAKLQQLTKGLLGLAQTGFDGKKLNWQELRLDQLVFDVKENADAILPGNSVVVSILQLPTNEDSMTITGSYDMLKIAISNIVLNACKYSHNTKVTLQLSFDEKWGKVTVMDSGIGIPPEDLKHIYDPFFRASNAHTYEGFGIGMPLSNNIIRLHGGKIVVSSTVNIGTTVQIFLPLGGIK
ncbi:MAG: HAMP domain-containing sensor histidine kinase [Chitinophagaceae bacterium]